MRSVFLALFVCAASLLPAATPARTPLQAPAMPYVKYTLPNGLEVILLEDHRLPLVATNIWYHVGPVKERAGRTGFAHLFEHLMFEGSRNVGEKAIFRYLESAGASEINGTTSFDRTNYFETLPSNELELAMWLESDRMGFLLDTLDSKKLENQRDVVRNERRQSVENAPYGIVDEAVFHELFPAAHPYRANVMGSHADIEAARLADVRDFFHQYYTPNNATLVIVGDFKPADARTMVERYFAPIPRGPAVETSKVVTPPITAERRVTITDQVQLPKVEIAWLTPPAYTAQDAAGDNLAHVLGEGRSSRLYRALVHEQQIAQSVTCSHTSLELASPFECELVARPGVKPEALEKAAEAEIDKLRATPPTQAEVDGARNVAETGLISELQSVGTKADLLNQFNQYTGDPGYLPKYITAMEAVTPQDVQRFAADFLGANQRVVVYGIPGEKKLNDVPRSTDTSDASVKIEPQYPAAFYTSQEFRKQPPVAGPDPVFQLPVPETFTLANGLKVYYVGQHDVPVFSADLLTRAGSDRDPADRPGLAFFTNAMLTRGTTTRSELQIAQESEGLGAGISGATGVSSYGLSATSLSNNAAPVMALLSDVALHPAFAADETTRVRNLMQTRLLQMRDDAQELAFSIAPKALYGADSPKGHLSLGTETSLKAITPPELSTFFQSWHSPQNSVLVIVGDVTRDQARQMAEASFGAWTAPTAAKDSVVEATPNTTPRVVAVDIPGAPQSVITMTGSGAPRNTPDYPALTVLNSGLGSLFSSRINMNLREEHGYTYGAFSIFLFGRNYGWYASGAQVRADVTVPALEQLQKELVRINTDPLTPTELKMSKEADLRVLPGSFASMGDIAGQMGELWLMDLPLDYYRNLPAQLEAVTSDQVAAAAKKYVQMNSLFTVVVGDKKQYADSIGKLGLGRIEYWNTDGFPESANK